MAAVSPYFPSDSNVPSLIWAIYESPVALYIRESETIFPVLQTFHVLGLMLMLGTILVVDLRILGVSLTSRSPLEVGRDLLPYTWAGFVVVLISGLLLLTAQVGRIYENDFLRAKLALLILAGINVIVFHLGSYRSIAQWGVSVTPGSARIAAATSLTLWSAVIIAGRYIAYY